MLFGEASSGYEPAWATSRRIISGGSLLTTTIRLFRSPPIRKLDVGARDEVESYVKWLDEWQPEAFDLKAVRKQFDL